MEARNRASQRPVAAIGAIGVAIDEPLLGQFLRGGFSRVPVGHVRERALGVSRAGADDTGQRRDPR